jgi:hypothetical protein
MPPLNHLLQEQLTLVGAKHIGARVKKLGLESTIKSLTPFLPDDCSLSQRIYHVLHNLKTPAVCGNSNPKKFISIKDGYSQMCTVKSCSFCKSQKSANVKKARAEMTSEQKQQIENKRRETCLRLFGHSAQSEKNREGFNKFYSDPENVKKQTDKHKQTIFQRYGVSSVCLIPSVQEKCQQTMKERYGVTNAFNLPNSRQKNALSRTNDEYKQQASQHAIDRHFPKLKLILEENNFEILFSKDDYVGGQKKIKYPVRHLDCGNVFEYEPRGGSSNIPICRMCNPVNGFKSSQEQQVFDFVKTLSNDAEQSDRKLISPMELDIVIHSKKIAIEFCGLLWHSQQFGGKDKYYHFDKWRMCKDQGYQLITIWDFEWTTKREKIESRFRHLLGNQKPLFGARQCQIKDIELNEARNFCDVHHLHGYQQSSIKLGAFFENHLVAVMTFGRRKITGSNTNEWEIIRFCSNQNIPGIASKLFKFFVTHYEPQTVISYSDNRWDSGRLYEHLGFFQANVPAPGYSYTKTYKSLEHRYNYTKANLIKKGYDSSLTEWEIMQSLGYDRVWDCGQIRWEWKNKP